MRVYTGIVQVQRADEVLPLKQHQERRKVRADVRENMSYLQLRLRYEIAVLELEKLKKRLRFRKLKPQQTFSELQQEYLDHRISIHIMQKELELH